MRNDVCVLITLYNSGSVQDKKETECFCEKKSAVRNEYYAAYSVGLRPRLVLAIHPLDWEAAAGADGELPSMVRYGGREYNIYRDYQTDESTVELTVG